jgi:leucyl aminopeptidase
MPFEARFKDMNQEIHTRRDTLEQSDDNALHAEKFARLGAAFAIELGKQTLPSTHIAETERPATRDDRWLVLFGLNALLAGVALLLARWAHTR